MVMYGWAVLLTATSVRALLSVLFQDCVFLKEPGYAETNWHSDLRMAPLDTNDFVTAWVPLRAVQGGERDSG
jgi:ectoine hydroxylase-related dioxygenase (phytanoyl-CoA dioxygenase family)